MGIILLTLFVFGYAAYVFQYMQKRKRMKRTIPKYIRYDVSVDRWVSSQTSSRDYDHINDKPMKGKDFETIESKFRKADGGQYYGDDV